MRKAFAISLLAALAFAGCKVNEIVEEIFESKSFTAIIEDNFDGAETRTSLDENGNVRWKQGDQVSIFAGSMVNEQYQVTDASDGKTSAGFNKVSGSGFVGGSEIDNNVAFYPYAASAEIARNGSAYVISDITLPATQTYSAGSFGNGAFPMAAVTSTKDDMLLKFKNVLGGLKLQLTGTATITSITVSGNNNEILCGAAEVTVSNSTTPSLNLTDATAKTVTLDCGEGVQLNSETATLFIIALPPMTMEGGFTVVVTDTEGKQMEIKTTKSQTINRSKLLKMPVVNYEGTSGPLTFTSSGETSISLVKVGTPDDVSLEYRVNGGSWTTYTVGSAIALADGENVSFRAGANGNNTFFLSSSDYHKFAVTGSGTVAASGSIMSLLNQEESTTIPSSYCFKQLFSKCVGLTSAPALPATTLAMNCYGGMFMNCTSLVSAPELPATTLEDSCYMGMFSGCTSLTTAPELPATTLAGFCYYGMFSGCMGLTSAPALPATTLASGCYMTMFKGCTSLTIAPKLPATTMVNSCYALMFSACHNLTTAPELPATTLADHCYISMFYDCSKLNYIKCLATDMSVEGCLSGWVTGVSSSGVFIKDPNTIWPVGDYGIPEGWTVYPTGLPAEVEAVDLGLPSGLKWANMNVGATSPDGYGGYFAWGETEPKADYSLETYKWCNGNSNTQTKYNTNSSYGIVDNNTFLDQEDDAAQVNWGGSWRMPTDEEWTELWTKCNWTWISQNGVYGRKVTGPNGSGIFLPAASYRYDTYLYDAGSVGFYWSSSLDTDYPYLAWYVYFDSGDVGRYRDVRNVGFSVRPVCE